MKRILGLTIALSLIALVLPASVSAVIMHGQCPFTTTKNQICLYESAQAGGDRVAIDNSGIASLKNVPHVAAGACLRWFIYTQGDEWNDCTNSTYLYIRSGYSVCLYKDANYVTLMTGVAGPKTRYYFDNFQQDILSSFRFVSGGTGNC